MPPRRRPNARILTPAGWAGVIAILAVAGASALAWMPLLHRQ